MQLQRLVHVHQHFPDRRLPDVAAAVRGEMEAADWTRAVNPGSRIAIGVGSRGVTNIDVIARAVVDYWKSRDVRSFIIPVMGSHGAGTAQGQADVLAKYGITEETMGAPVVSSLDVVEVGTTPEGIEVLMDRTAYESDGVMLCARVKWHTDFDGKLESGIHKMMAIGLGKWAGAQRYHTHAYKLGLEQVIRGVGRVILDTGKMLGGMAILEDAYHNTAEVRAVGAQGMVEREEELLERAKSWKPDLPVAEVDILIVDEIGKHISGAGMDTKIINRSSRKGKNSWEHLPKVDRILVRDLSPLSYGNAIGIGLADMVTDRMVEKVDSNATWVNSLTASSLSGSKIPIHFPNDRTCLEKLAPTVGKLDTSEVTLAWIRNTMELGDLAVSENLLPELKQNPQVEILSESRELEFDGDGNLVSPFVAETVAH